MCDVWSWDLEGILVFLQGVLTPWFNHGNEQPLCKSSLHNQLHRVCIKNLSIQGVETPWNKSRYFGILCFLQGVLTPWNNTCNKQTCQDIEWRLRPTFDFFVARNYFLSVVQFCYLYQYKTILSSYTSPFSLTISKKYIPALWSSRFSNNSLR